MFRGGWLSSHANRILIWHYALTFVVRYTSDDPGAVGFSFRPPRLAAVSVGDEVQLLPRLSGLMTANGDFHCLVVGGGVYCRARAPPLTFSHCGDGPSGPSAAAAPRAVSARCCCSLATFGSSSACCSGARHYFGAAICAVCVILAFAFLRGRPSRVPLRVESSR